MNKVYSEKEIIRLLRSLKSVPFAQPSETFRQNARIRILNNISHETKNQRIVDLFTYRRLSPVWRFATVFSLALLFLGTTTLSLAQSSLPQDKLFPLKIASEQVLLAVTPFDDWQMQLALDFADRRISEIREAQTQDHGEVPKQAIQNYQKSIKTAEDINKKIESDKYAQKLSDHENTLSKLLAPSLITPPESNQPVQKTPKKLLPESNSPAAGPADNGNKNNNGNDNNQNSNNGNSVQGVQEPPAQNLLPPVEIPNPNLP